MSQWGAFGQAKAGRDYRTILGHYYRGTQIGSAPTSILERVRVLVGDGLAKVTVTNALAVFDANGKRYVLPIGPVTIGPKLQLPVGEEGKQLALPGPLTFRATPGSFLTVGDKGYRGDLSGREGGGEAPAGQRRRARGVPARRRSRRDAEGLAARGAQGAGGRRAHVCRRAPREREGLRPLLRLAQPGVLRRRLGGSRTDARGHRDEGRDRHLRRRAGADALLLLERRPNDQLARRLRHRYPYLQAVDDRWDSVSPNFRWPSQLLTGPQLAKRFGIGGAVTDVSYLPGAPGRPAAIRLATAAGSTDVRLSDVRARLGLKSTGFRLGMMRLDGPTVTEPNGKVRLTGLARNVEAVVLERRGSGAPGPRCGRLRPLTTGRSRCRSVSTRRPCFG